MPLSHPLTNNLQVSSSSFARFGLFLRSLSPWLFEAVLEIYVSWMAAGSRQYDVQSKTLTNLLKEYKLGTVQLLKVDVEGAEVEVTLRYAT
jgi:FkbM family methyltransferase